jgi:hypothetical protein
VPDLFIPLFSWWKIAITLILALRWPLECNRRFQQLRMSAIQSLPIRHAVDVLFATVLLTIAVIVDHVDCTQEISS